ncbi:uncharacterized protein LOC111266288 [Varroa jacobsoni]|uniref:uncharacterized protein LOC111266288 n=1 Tax=Varroa jacobsoni TaxID=62625 RepID=UPI000BF506D6|nr:uncharacterized protein LOC111266288 [Varroa jacobsoni]
MSLPKLLLPAPKCFWTIYIGSLSIYGKEFVVTSFLGKHEHRLRRYLEALFIYRSAIHVSCPGRLFSLLVKPPVRGRGASYIMRRWKEMLLFARSLSISKAILAVASSSFSRLKKKCQRR